MAFEGGGGLGVEVSGEGRIGVVGEACRIDRWTANVNGYMERSAPISKKQPECHQVESSPSNKPLQIQHANVCSCITQPDSEAIQSLSPIATSSRFDALVSVFSSPSA